jgi:hypothetical protein
LHEVNHAGDTGEKNGEAEGREAARLSVRRRVGVDRGKEADQGRGTQQDEDFEDGQERFARLETLNPGARGTDQDPDHPGDDVHHRESKNCGG